MSFIRVRTTSLNEGKVVEYLIPVDNVHIVMPTDAGTRIYLKPNGESFVNTIETLSNIHNLIRGERSYVPR